MLDTECLGSLDDSLQVEVGIVPRDQVETTLAMSLGTNQERGARLWDQFREAGCPEWHLTKQTVPKSESSNLICDLPGTSERTIVVGAHFDKSLEGDGVADNWSGASLLPALFRSLGSRPRFHTFRFIAFADEELGLLGSKHYVETLSKDEHDQIQAMINLDTLGLGLTKMEIQRSDAELACLLWGASLATETELQLVNVHMVGLSDFEPFRASGIPIVIIHSIDQETLPILHSKRDTLEQIDRDAFYSSYRLVAVFLGFLDDRLRGSAPESRE